jgi:hypothetical protein
MTDKLEGTIQLDGLLQGKLPPVPDAEDRLREWLKGAARAGLNFSLELDRNSFSLLAPDAPIPVAKLGEDAPATICAALQELLKGIPDRGRDGLMSTIRSVEYRPNAEVQTLYALGPDGSFQARSRSVPTRTVAPLVPPSARQKIKVAAIGLVFAAAIFAVSAIFVDYRSLYSDIKDKLTPFSADSVQVDAGAFSPYFSVTKKEIIDSGRTFALTLTRGKKFPTSQPDFGPLLEDSHKSVDAMLLCEALGKGYIRCEFFDTKGQFIQQGQYRITDLRDKDTVVIDLPVIRDPRMEKIRFAY